MSQKVTDDTARGFLDEYTGGALTSKLPRTIIYTLFRPGTLSKEWLAGNREKLASPVIVFFALAAISTLVMWIFRDRLGQSQEELFSKFQPIELIFSTPLRFAYAFDYLRPYVIDAASDMRAYSQRMSVVSSLSLPFLMLGTSVAFAIGTLYTQRRASLYDYLIISANIFNAALIIQILTTALVTMLPDGSLGIAAYFKTDRFGPRSDHFFVFSLVLSNVLSVMMLVYGFLHLKAVFHLNLLTATLRTAISFVCGTAATLTVSFAIWIVALFPSPLYSPFISP